MKTKYKDEPSFALPVPITVPTIPPIKVLKKKYEKVLRSGMITNSFFVREFEQKVASYIGVKHAIALGSCTSGLMLIMKSLELTGEVILPSFTFHATAHAVVWNGLTPVFVDCDPRTYNLDPAAVEKAITPKTSAIVAVHIFGNPPDIEALQAITKRYALRLIFDAAHGFGTRYKGKPVGGFGDAESFSLSPTKLLTAGEGGIVTTNDDLLAAKIRAGRNYGDTGNYNPEFSGLSARMSEFNALLGIESLKMLEKNVAARNKTAKMYRKLLSRTPGISFQSIDNKNRSSFKDFSIKIDPQAYGLSRDELCQRLLQENVITKKYFDPPLHKQIAFTKYVDEKTYWPITEDLANNSLSLPLFSHIEGKAVNKICSLIKKISKHNS